MTFTQIKSKKKKYFTFLYLFTYHRHVIRISLKCNKYEVLSVIINFAEEYVKNSSSVSLLTNDKNIHTSV